MEGLRWQAAGCGESRAETGHVCVCGRQQGPGAAAPALWRALLVGSHVS